MEIETGRHNLQQIQRVRRWYGNDTLSGGEDFEMSIRVEGNLGNQFKPELWEGFKTYPFPSGYFMRMEGLSYKSADNWTIIAGDEQTGFGVGHGSILLDRCAGMGRAGGWTGAWAHRSA